MLICDECKQGVRSVTGHTIFMAPVNPRQSPIANIDLCKGCARIFQKRITDLVRRIKRGRR